MLMVSKIAWVLGQEITSQPLPLYLATQACQILVSHHMQTPTQATKLYVRQDPQPAHGMVYLKLGSS